MPIGPRLPQHPDQVVCLADWSPDEEFPFGPQGAKPKRIVVCPNPPPHPFLIGGHRYLFKEPTGTWAPQIWSEVIAYELSRDTGVPVPPAFVATGPGKGNPGVLIEFFYGHPQEPARRLIDGIERLQAWGMQTNLQRGSLRDNIDICRLQKVPEWRRWWAQTLAFDALIGNTDRHSQNWGFLATAGADGQLTYSMAPAFDNGTSLGFIIGEPQLDRFRRPAALAKLIRNGRHHFGWTSGDVESAQHARLCRRYADRFSSTKNIMREVTEVSDVRIDAIVSWCTRFGFPLPFTESRAQFVAAQLRGRRNALVAALGD